MFELEILNHWIAPQQGKNHSEIDEEPQFGFLSVFPAYLFI